MEWVEVRGRSVDVAVAAAMQELGVQDREQIDVEVIEEPDKGFLGIGRKDALVRVKRKRKPGRRRGRGRGRGRKPEGDKPSEDRGSGKGGGRQQQRPAGGGGQKSGDRAPKGKGTNQRASGKPSGGSRSGKGESGGGRGEKRQQPAKASGPKGGVVSEDAEVTVDIASQAEVVGEFLEGLLASFGLEGEVATRVEDDIIYADVDGEQTEALVGDKATIMQAIHELLRTVVQRKTMAGARIRLDINGYGERRREALVIYAGRLAEQVREDGGEIMLEPMNPADRKTVHDAVADLEGVRSFSEGEEPRRSVVIAPAD